MSVVIADDNPEISPLDFANRAFDRDLRDMVHKALVAQRTALAFQPIAVVGEEASLAFHEGLIRVLDEAGRIIPAQHFMHAVEETGLGRDIDCAALRLAFVQLRGRPDLRLSVNVSARSLGDSAWRAELEHGLRMGQRVCERLILEISEKSAMLLPELVIRFMAEMQPRGVSFALDDFGGGSTAFRHLKDFFFDMVKIDPAFIRDVDRHPDNQVLTGALITVAHQFEMFAIAEGVETAAEAEALAALGCDCLQGYHIGFPRLKL